MNDVNAVKQCLKNLRSIYVLFGILLLLPVTSSSLPQDTSEEATETMTLTFRGTPIEEAYEMLARQKRVNILLGNNVKGDVSANLYDVSIEEAIRFIAAAAGYVVENRGGTYMVLDRKDAGMDSTSSNTTIRALKVQYSDPKVVTDLLEKHLSRYGKITTLEERHLLVVEDLPDFIDRIEGLLSEVDVEPKQILIEAKILEITLNADETFGIDWAAMVDDSQFGTKGFANPLSPGFFVDVMTQDLELFLSALARKGRVRTLSTPKLMLLENGDAEVIIGDRIGYRVTTTINQVTTESIEFLETGVILNVKGSVDRLGRVMLEIHPEVSTGEVKDGIPNKRTTEVTTQLLTEDGAQVFIGGLISSSSTDSRSGIPYVSDIPVMGRLFSRDEKIVINKETVVVITPHIFNLEHQKEALEYAIKSKAVREDILNKTDKIMPSYLPIKETQIKHEPQTVPPATSNDFEGTEDW